ncbi:hypothetical protein FACS1894208_02930 [Clostridia bacterium]|nr:hypothetical protein FACS1894208_02930 [Clostridia bacterium]
MGVGVGSSFKGLGVSIGEGEGDETDADGEGEGDETDADGEGDGDGSSFAGTIEYIKTRTANIKTTRLTTLSALFFFTTSRYTKPISAATASAPMKPKTAIFIFASYLSNLKTEIGS